MGGNYVNVSDDAAWTLGANPFTVELWVNYRTVQGTDPFVAHSEGQGSVNKWLFWDTNYDTQTQQVTPQVDIRWLTGPAPLWFEPVSQPFTPLPGRWYHLAVTRDGSTYSLYVNGVLARTGQDSHVIPDAATPLTIGHAEWTYFDGMLDEVSMYGRALSAAEIAVIYNAGTAGKCGLSQPPVANAGPTVVGSEGSLVTFDGSASTPPGNDMSYRWSFGDGGSATGVRPNHVYSDNGVYTVTLVVTDPAGRSSQSTTLATIANVPPSVGAVSVPSNPTAAGTAIVVSAPFGDPGILDTHTAVIAWGDGSASTVSVTEANGSGSTSGLHTYSAGGVYTVTVKVTDRDGGTGTATASQSVVIYDPSAGFVTGGGWINSPSGAYTANTGLTGKATIGFVTKYLSGATTPTGNAEFQLAAAKFNFKATSFDWLVVTGGTAQIRGSGSINGAGDYGMLLSVIDGTRSGSGSDNLRMKVWDKSKGTIIYDSQLGAAELSAPGSVLMGGRIVIH